MRNLVFMAVFALLVPIVLHAEIATTQPRSVTKVVWSNGVDSTSKASLVITRHETRSRLEGATSEQVHIDHYLRVSDYEEKSKKDGAKVWIHFIPASDLANGYVEPEFLSAAYRDGIAVVVLNDGLPGQPLTAYVQAWIKDDGQWEPNRLTKDDHLGPEAENVTISIVDNRTVRLSVEFTDGTKKQFQFDAGAEVTEAER